MKAFAGVALASVMTLTAAVASADQPAAPTPAPAASNAAPAATPLQTRPAKKLELSTMKDESTPIGYKLLAGAIVVAGAIVYVKKKKGGITKNTKKKSSIDLLARHSVGVRSEVLVVEVEGTRLLVGMTPGSMNTLAVLQTPEGVIGEESPLMGEEKYMTEEEVADVRKPSSLIKQLVKHVDDEEDELPPVRVGAPRKAAQAQVSADQEEIDELEGRVRSLLDARKKKAPESSRALPARRPVPQATAQAPRVPGQAKGLLLSMQDPDITKLGDW